MSWVHPSSGCIPSGLAEVTAWPLFCRVPLWQTACGPCRSRHKLYAVSKVTQKSTAAPESRDQNPWCPWHGCGLVQTTEPCSARMRGTHWARENRGWKQDMEPNNFICLRCSLYCCKSYWSLHSVKRNGHLRFDSPEPVSSTNIGIRN